MTNLKSCPFCKSKSIGMNNDTGPHDGYYIEWIECQACGATAENEEKWNTRPEAADDNQLLQVMKYAVFNYSTACVEKMKVYISSLRRAGFISHKNDAVAAIEFAVKIDDHYEMRAFLEGWQHGDTTEWPEFKPEAA